MVPDRGSVDEPNDRIEYEVSSTRLVGPVVTDHAIVGDRLHIGLVEVTDDLGAVESGGPWVVVIPYDGAPVCALFSETHPVSEAESFLGGTGARWIPPERTAWRSSLDRDEFVERVGSIREEITEGNVYQANLTRIMSAPVETDDVWPLARIVMRENPAPYAAVVSLNEPRLRIVSASPELFLARNGRTITSSPIKGTAATVDGFLPKDEAENIMIVDMARNDLGMICQWGSVEEYSLLDVEAHPGLYHLVSTVRGSLHHGCTWSKIIDATFPPASVTGAPKIAALDLIDRLEPTSRRFYCGAIGWIDEDGQRGELNVAIRTFWIDDGHIHFGTGGGITHGSDPEGEWRETELKAKNLIGAVSGPDGPAGTTTVEQQ